MKFIKVTRKQNADGVVTPSWPCQILSCGFETDTIYGIDDTIDISTPVFNQMNVELLTYDSVRDTAIAEGDSVPVLGDGDGLIVTFKFDGESETRVREWSTYIIDTEVKAGIDSYLSHQAKMKGFVYNGVDCSVTAEDQWGLHSLENYILAGNAVKYHFKNGNTLILDETNYVDFKTQWAAARQSFFPL